MVKNLPALAGDVRDAGLIPGLERSSGGGNGNPLHYSCLGNAMDRGSWWATVPTWDPYMGSQTSQIQLSD